MKNKLFLMGMIALLCALGVIVVSCDDGNGGDGDDNLPVKTIEWETDGNGYTQFYTNDAQYYYHYFTASADHSGDTYEAEVKKLSGNATYGYGMLFCYDSSNPDSLSYYRLLITTRGSYQIHKRVAGTWAANPITNWTASAALNAGYNQANKLKVVKADNNFTVYINNQQVDTFTDSDITGTKIGAYVGVGESDEESFPNTPVDVRVKVLQ
jgi:hypothetical protein